MNHGSLAKKRGSLSKQLSTTTGVPEVSEVSFLSPSNIDSSRTAEISKETGNTVIPVCLWCLCIQVIKLPLMPMCIVQHSITKQFYVTCHTS
jgi:hypothetical protein